MLTRMIQEADIVGANVVGKGSGKVFTRQNMYGIYLRCLTSGGVELTRAQILNDITSIVVRINGTVIVDANATFLLDLQKYYGDSINAGNVNGIIPINFTPRHLALASERALYAIGPKGINDVSIEVTIAAIAQVSQIQVYVEVDYLQPREIGQHVRIEKFPQVFSTTGVQQLTQLPFLEPNALGYLAYHVKYSAGSLDKVTVKRNGSEVFQQLAAKLNQVILNLRRRTPQSGYFHVDFGKNDDLLAYLPIPGTDGLYHEFTWSSAAPNGYDVYTERIFKTL